MKTLRHKFVEFIPDQLDEGILYVSVEYATAIHNCVCGCGQQVVTPLSPTDWELKYDGKTVSLYPSIGNWNFACQSHYWITKNKIRHARRWNEWQIDSGRKNDAERKRDYFARGKIQPGDYD